MHPVDLEASRNISHCRIHVERVIGVLRQKYRILEGTLPISLLSTGGSEPILNKIVHLCCALINMCPPIELIRNRSSMKQKLLLLEKFISTIKTSDSDNKPSLTEIEIRFKDHECMLSEFDKIQSMIESKCSEEHLEEHYLEREEFQERYYVSQQFLSDYLKNAFGNASPNQSQINSNQPQSNSSGHFDPLQNMLLPKIKLPTFTGEFQYWTSFETSFMATILNNVYLTDNQRFQFLKVSLQGYALRLIEGLENVVNPFDKAWQQLCDRFDKKHFILDSHFKSLLGLQSLQRENYSSFRTLLDEVSKHLTALDGLGVTKEELFDSFLIHVISSKLDKNTLRVWKEQKHNSELPSLDEFMNFLKDKSDILQSLDASDQKVSTSNKFHQQANRSTCNVSVTANKQLKCNYCKKEHTIYKCTEFLALSVDERLKKVKGLNLCFNCLLTGHDVSKCRLSTCSICKNKHNTLLHKDSKARDNSETQASVGSVETHVHHVSMQQQPSIDASKSDQVLLSTIMYKIKDVKGNLHDCRALLDCGAQTNLITEKLCRTLNIPLESTNVSLVGFNQAKSHLDKKCSIKLISNYNNYQCDISCLVVPIITCNIPPHLFNISQLGIPSNIALSDPSFECPRDVDILLGASIFWDLLLSGKIHLGKNMPSLRNTQFGWIITGTIPIQNNISVCNLATVHISEDDQLKKFWELEEKDTHRLENGQFVVKFPLKYSPQLLGESKETAIKRFISNSTIENSVLNIGDQTGCSTLGIQWINTSDMLKYKIRDLSSDNNITKRYILSIIAQIYDPLGLLSPAIILIKILIQELWSLHIPWDSSIPLDLKNKWLQFQHELTTLNSLHIPPSC
nr:unnamed protein product [Callosobruchus analis]